MTARIMHSQTSESSPLVQSNWGDEIYLNADTDGVFVEHSLLNLEGDSAESLVFISGVGASYLSGELTAKQVILSDEAHRVLVGKFSKTSFLVCQYFRPITIGNLTLELLPSGASHGSSFLRIEKKNDSLFFASQWSRKISGSIRRAVYKKAKTLLLKLHVDPTTVLATNSRRETERLIEFAQKITHAGETVVAVVDSFGEAQNLAGRLYEEGLNVAFEPKLLSIMKIIYESMPPAYAPAWLKNLRGTQTKSVGAQVILVSKQHLVAKSTKSLPQGIWVWIGPDYPDHSFAPTISQLNFSDTFFIQSAPDLAEIFELVGEVSPSQILVYGQGAEQCVHQMHARGLRAEVFAPPKIATLF